MGYVCDRDSTLALCSQHRVSKMNLSCKGSCKSATEGKTPNTRHINWSKSYKDQRVHKRIKRQNSDTLGTKSLSETSFRILQSPSGRPGYLGKDWRTKAHTNKHTPNMNITLEYRSCRIILKTL